MSYWPGRNKHAKTTFGGLSRSKLMARIRSKENATTELRLMSLFRATRVRGWRRGVPLPGKPDFVFPKSKLVIFVDGCFWHGHGCGHNLTPKRNAKMWLMKIRGNHKRDLQINRKLRLAGWNVIRIWECELARHSQIQINRIQKTLEKITK